MSGLIAKQGPPARVLDLWRNRKIRLVVSSAINQEILDVLQRPSVVDAFGISERNVARLEALLKRKRVTAHVTPRAHFHVCRDPKDDKFLDAAVAGKAAFLVTNDNDLLDLKEFRGIKIASVHEFLAMMESV